MGLWQSLAQKFPNSKNCETHFTIKKTELGIVSNSSGLQDTIIDNEHDEIPVIIFYSTENF